MDNLASSILEILLFSLIPFIWWLVTARKKQNFFSWLGLKRATADNRKSLILWTTSVIIAFLFVAVYVLYLVKNVETATSEFDVLGAKAIPAVIVYAVFKTALSEEIFFRGFLLKRLSSKFGFTAGNIIQSVLFGIMHGAMFFGAVDTVKAILIVIFTAAVAWFMGYINEKKAGGSILPSWCIHAVSNIFSGLFSAFSII